MRRASSIVRALCALLLTVPAALAAAQAGGERGPLNVLFIMTDQHNARMMGCSDNGYGGVTRSLTPSLDRLALGGVRFENAYCATPQCCPTRYSLITGQWPHTHGLRWNGVWEPRGAATLPELARAAGYATATIGKHHLYWLDVVPRTVDHGFETVVSVRDYASFCFAHMSSPMWNPLTAWGMPNLPANLATFTGFTPNPNDLHSSGYFANQAIRFLEGRAADGRPFLCYLSFFGPHTPLLPTGPPAAEDWAHLYHPFDGLALPPNLDKAAPTDRLAQLQAAYAGVTDDEWREILSYYYGLITQIDFNIGRVLLRLAELGLSENTIVVYTSDHGEMASEMRCWTKGAGSYDAIAKVPLIVRLPHVVPAGEVRPTLVGSVDLVPTLLELTGLPVGDDDRERMDGISLVDVLLDRPDAPRPNAVYSEFGSSILPSVLNHRMVRTERYKYSLDTRLGGQEEFYDLVADPFERTNLVTTLDPVEQAELARHRVLLARWWNDELGHAPEYRVSGDGSDRPVKAEQPWPAFGALDVPRDVDPRWLPSSASEQQAVYLGLDGAPMKLLRELPGTADRVNLGALPPSTLVAWRVDGRNANGLRTGDVWVFRTAADSARLAGIAGEPAPQDAAQGTGLDPLLAWTPAKGAEAQALYFGPAGRAVLAARLPRTAGSFAPGRLLGGVEYEWRVDASTVEGVTRGDVWRFTTTEAGLPRRTATLHPQHLARAARVTAAQPLSWLAVPGAMRYEVSLGRFQPLEHVADVTNASFDPGPLEPDTTYFWRVDTVNDRGVTRGSTWRFTTEP